METDSLGADNPIYRLNHAVVLIALVWHLGMVRKGNTVAERVSEMVHAPVTGTSRLLAPPQRRTRNMAARRFAVINRVRITDPYVYTVRWNDDPGRIFITELHPRMFIPWPENMPCPVPSSHPTRYEWTLDTMHNEHSVTYPSSSEELVEQMAQTRGYLHHPADTSSSKTSDGASSITSIGSHEGAKRVSETTIDQGGKRGNKAVYLDDTAVHDDRFVARNWCRFVSAILA